MLSQTTRVWIIIVCRTLQGAIALFVLYFLFLVFAPLATDWYADWKEEFLWNQVIAWDQSKWAETDPKARLNNPRFHMRKSLPLKAGMDQKAVMALLGPKGAVPGSYSRESFAKEEPGLIPNANRKTVAWTLEYPLGEDNDDYSDVRYDLKVVFDRDHRLVDAYTSFVATYWEEE